LFVLPTDNPRDFSPSWLNLDLSLRLPITSGLGLNVYLENLGGQTYEKVNRIYQPGTTFRIGLSSDF
jgi:vitamin B12 transporter